MHPKDKEILEEIHIIKNHSKGTKYVYSQALKKYTDFYDTPMYKLIEEAENEEEEKIRWKNRKLKKRLIKFRQHLSTKHTKNSMKSIFNTTCSIYKYFEIEIHDLPQISDKGLKQIAPIQYKDLPTKELLRKVLDISTPLMKAVTVFMISSGCARKEALSLTIKDYIQATADYHNSNDIYEVIFLLNQQENVVPTFNVWRAKTNKYYTTYSTPESVKYINSYLLSRTDNLSDDAKLFKIYPANLVRNYCQINDELNLGKVNDGYNRIRCHMMRKFHASALYNDGLGIDVVNDLQGKAKNKVDSAYFMTNPDDLKAQYMAHMDAVTIGTEVTKITAKSPEYILLENELNNKQMEVTSLNLRMDKLEKAILNNISSEDILSIDKYF